MLAPFLRRTSSGSWKMPYRFLVNAASRATGRLGWARSALGALVGIGFAALVTHMLLPASSPNLPWMIASVGASSVLVFALPASPLAQPWAVFGGNMLSAMIGLVAGHMVPVPELAYALAVGLAIAGMSMARCLHPPGGACALLGALGAAHGPLDLLLPLFLNNLGLLAIGWLYNNFTGHPWPHRMASAPPVPMQGWIATYDAEDLDAVLEEWDEVLDVSRDDLDALFRAVERRVQRRWQNKPPQ
jgi:CBS domain-containing membrane protein